MRYIWMSTKQKSKVHILNSEGRTLCRAENCAKNTSKRLDTRSDTPCSSRSMCGICSYLNGETKAQTGKARSSGFRNDRDFYGSWEWTNLRYEVLKKHGPRCMLCGADSRTQKIVVDHIKSRKLHPELELDFNNLQVLCDPCNRGKGHRDETDWRDLNEELDAQAASHMKNL